VGHLEGIRGLLLDLDGVIYDGGSPVPGAADAVARLGLPRLFVTNTTSRPRAAIVERLAGCGVAATPGDLLTPATAAAAWLAAQDGGGVALFAPAALREEFAGLDLVERDARYVVVGDLGPAWDFATLNRAFRLLMARPDATLVALGMTRYWSTPDGLALDVAPFVVALEHASGKRATVLGKPAPEFFRAGVRRLGLEPHAVLMVGDDVRTDVGGAQAAGLRAALVKTGKFRPADLEGDLRPDLVLDSLADLNLP